MHLTYTKEEIFTILMFRDHAGCRRREYEPDEIINFQNGMRAERFEKTWFICNNNNNKRYIWHKEERPDMPIILGDMLMRLFDWLFTHGMLANYRYYDKEMKTMLVRAIPEVVRPDKDDESVMNFYDIPQPNTLTDEQIQSIFIEPEKDNFSINLVPICTLVTQIPKRDIF